MCRMSGVLPILYSFRRCPYAIRARMALLQAGVTVELREVDLEHKPAALLRASPAGTVPVLDTHDDGVLVHSLDIMRWALARNDVDAWLTRGDAVRNQMLVDANDGDFKYWLDRYKYAGRYPERPQVEYRQEAARCLITVLEAYLATAPFVGGDAPCWADVAVFPFVRQFAGVDALWWRNAPYPQTQRWLQVWTDGALFLASMAKQAVWQPGDTPLLFASTAIRPQRTAMSATTA